MSAAGPAPQQGRTRGPHFFVAAADLDGASTLLRGAEARHLAAVLRARAGAPVSISDGAGRIWQGRVRDVAGDTVEIDLDEERHVPPPRPRLTVVHALPKGRKLDDVVQRLTELGVDRIVPVHASRCDVRLDPAKAERAVARWRAVALAAAKQSRRAWLPAVDTVTDWAAAFPPGTAGTVLWEEAGVPLRDVLPADAAELVLAIGPEGGLTAAEVSASGLPAATLGPTVLRTETAALVAATAVLCLLGRLA